MEHPSPIRLAFHGFSDQNEQQRLMGLFARSRTWQQPWEIVKNTEDAEFLLMASDQVGTADYPEHITQQQIIAYAMTPSKSACWHLRRRSDAPLPSLLEFTLLMQQIGQAYCHHHPPKPIIKTTPLPSRRSEPVVSAERPKIVIVGSVGAGKTTAVHTLSGGHCVSTEAKPSDQVQLNKQATTVAMDFGTTTLADGTALRIYGSPGQRRFDFMVNILLKNARGLIILISNELSDALTELDYYLYTYKDFLRDHPAVIGVTHHERRPRPSVQDYQQIIQKRGQVFPVFKVDARKPTDMETLVHALLSHDLP